MDATRRQSFDDPDGPMRRWHPAALRDTDIEVRIAVRIGVHTGEIEPGPRIEAFRRA